MSPGIIHPCSSNLKSAWFFRDSPLIATPQNTAHQHILNFLLAFFFDEKRQANIGKHHTCSIDANVLNRLKLAKPTVFHSMSNEIISVIIASAQSVAKVFLIGAVGYGAVLFPREAPFLPSQAVSTVARFAFHTLLLSLIYSTTAVSVSAESMGDYWFVFVSAFFVVGISYAVATFVGRWCIPIQDPQDFCALRIAASFPNIVSLPILIFPSLCEHQVVYENFTSHLDDNSDMDASQLRQQCAAEANTMIFIYFFGWSLLFWSLGHRQLMEAARLKAQKSDGTHTEGEGSSPEADSEKGSSAQEETKEETKPTTNENSEEGSSAQEEKKEETKPSTNEDSQPPTLLQTISKSLRQTVTSPGFLALSAGIITGFIPPLKSALFEPGGALRFIGDAVQTLGRASSPISTMVVAASLVPPPTDAPNNNDQPPSTTSANEQEEQDNPIMGDPNFGPRRRRTLLQVGTSMRQLSTKWLLASKPRSSPEQRRMLLWFCLSRLILSPALVVGCLLGLDSFGLLQGVPPLSKLVVVINASLPGALMVVVLLKSQPALADCAAAVAQVYLPTYLISILTIAAWTSVGMWISLPDADGEE
jgi:predicted permease